MPRVVPDQRSKFENDEMFRKLSRESEVCMHNRGRTSSCILSHLGTFSTGLHAIELTSLLYSADQVYDVQGQTSSRTYTTLSERLQRRPNKCCKCCNRAEFVLIEKRVCSNWKRVRSSWERSF